MRTVIAEDNSDRRTRQASAPAEEVCFDLRLPLMLLKKRYWLRFSMATNTHFGGPGSLPSAKQVALSLTTKAAIVTLLSIVLGETIFILYLVKCLFGIDFFPDFHLLS